MWGWKGKWRSHFLVLSKHELAKKLFGNWMCLGPHVMLAGDCYRSWSFLNIQIYTVACCWQWSEWWKHTEYECVHSMYKELIVQAVVHCNVFNLLIVFQRNNWDAKALPEGYTVHTSGGATLLISVFLTSLNAMCVKAFNGNCVIGLSKLSGNLGVDTSTVNLWVTWKRLTLRNLALTMRSYRPKMTMRSYRPKMLPPQLNLWVHLKSSKIPMHFVDAQFWQTFLP